MVDFKTNENLSNLWMKVQPSTAQDLFQKGISRDNYSMNEIVSDLHKNMTEAKQFQDKQSTKALAGRIKDISEQALDKYQGLFGGIRAFFSGLRNLFTIGTFKSSEHLGIDLANELLESTLTAGDLQKLGEQAKANLSNTNLFNVTGQGQMKNEQKAFMNTLKEKLGKLDLRQWEEDTASTPTSKTFNVKLFEKSATNNIPMTTITIAKDFQIKFNRDENTKETIISFPKGGVTAKVSAAPVTLREIRLKDQTDQVVVKTSFLDQTVSYEYAMSILNSILKGK